VCIHQPVLPDPLAVFPVPNAANYTTQSLKQAKYTGNLTYTLQPGVYIGGIAISGTANVILTPGMYYMSGGGFSVGGTASVTGSGVTIYSGGTMAGKKVTAAGDVDITTNGKVILTAPTTGSYSGMTIFVDRTSNATVNLQPSNATQCATTAAVGQPQGCMGGISGTIYAPSQDAIVNVKAAGTANLQVIAGRMLITNGSTAHFTFNSAGFASTTTTISLIE
jgi:hypothetical protein